MIEARDGGFGFMPCNWNVGEPAIRPAAPAAIDLNESEHSELIEVSTPLAGTDEDLSL